MNGEGANPDSLVVRFLERTRADVGRLRTLATSLRLDGHAQFMEIEQIAHSIHGTGAMIGFPAVSKSGGAIEHCVDLLICPESKGQAVAPAVRVRLLELIEALARALDAAHATKPSESAMFR